MATATATATMTDSPSVSRTTTSSSDPSCTTAVPGKNGHVPIDACNSYYNFDPQFAPAVAVCVLFGIMTAIHIAEAIIFRKRYAWVLIMGAAWETIAFALHALGSLDQQNIGYSVGHTLLFLLAPLWVNAFAYMTFARLAHMLRAPSARSLCLADDIEMGREEEEGNLPRQKGTRDTRVLGGFLRTTSVSRLFVWADIATFLVQAAGGIMTSPGSGEEAERWGLRVYMIGMGLQELAILGFVGLMVAFQWKMTTGDKAEGGSGYGFGVGERGRNWRRVLYTLYAVLVAITVRIIYRMVEFAGGEDPSTNSVPFHEAYSYALDAFPILAALLILAIWHPGRVLQGENSDFRLVREEKKAAKMERKREKKEKKMEKKEKKKEKKKEVGEEAGFEDVSLGGEPRSVD